MLYICSDARTFVRSRHPGPSRRGRAVTPAAGTPARARRRASRAAWIGGLRIGAGAPVAIEAALRPDPAAPGAVAATIAALRAVEEAGAGLARLACTTREAALLLGRVAPSCALPLVADVGAADPSIALAAVEAGARAAWIDPGCQDADALAELAEVARHWGCVLGLLLRAPRGGAAASRAPSPPIARAQEAMAQARRLEVLGCRDVVLALRLDDPVEAMAALRALGQASDLPIALAPGQGIVPSALAIGLPLAQGIGDLVHLPHATDPAAEARAATQAVRALGLRPRGVDLRVEDGFARLRGDGGALVAALERRLAPLGHVSLDVALSVAPSPDPSGPAPVAGGAEAGGEDALRIACGGSAGMPADAFVARVAAIVEDRAGASQARDLRGLLAAAGADADPSARMWVEAAAALFAQYRGRSARIVWGSPLGEAAWLRLVGRRAPWQAPRLPGGVVERDEAATAVSTALGLAIAARASGERVDAIAVIDQAAMASGATIEAIRAARAAAVRLVVVLLDPAIDDAGLPGTVAAQLSRLVSSSPYLAMRDLGRSIVRNLPGPGYDIARRAEEFARGIAAGGFMFEELGAYYVGPVSGRRYDQLLPVLRNLADAPRDQPVLLHVAAGRLPAPPPRAARGASEPLASALVSALASRPRATLVLLQARGASADAFAAVARAHGARCLRAGEGERHGLGLARGLAGGGQVPVVLADRRSLFLGAGGTLRAWARLGLPLVLLVDLAAGHDDRAWLDAPPLDLAALPGFEVLHAASAQALAPLLDAALGAGDRPVVVAHGFEDRAGGGADAATDIDGPGRGEDVAILAVGRGVAMARAAAGLLAAQGIGARVVDVVRAQPLDGAATLALARAHRALVVLEDPGLAAGIGAAASGAIGPAQASRLRVLRAGRRAPREIADAARAMLAAGNDMDIASGGPDADPGGQ